MMNGLTPSLLFLMSLMMVIVMTKRILKKKTGRPKGLTDDKRRSLDTNVRECLNDITLEHEALYLDDLKKGHKRLKRGTPENAIACHSNRHGLEDEKNSFATKKHHEWSSHQRSSEMPTTSRNCFPIA